MKEYNIEIGTIYSNYTNEDTIAIGGLCAKAKDRTLTINKDGTLEIIALNNQKELASNEIWELKNLLKETDYCATKCSELGLSMKDAYPEIYQRRIEARQRINELESFL